MRIIQKTVRGLRTATLAAVMLGCTAVSWGQVATPTGPDFEAFRAAKQAYFHNPAKAVELFRGFVAKYQESQWTAESYYWLARSLEAAKADRAETIKAYTLFLRRYPEHALATDATFYIAELYRNQRTGNEDLEKALERYRQFIRTYPTSDRVPEAWFKIGDTLRVLRGFDKSLEAFRKVTDNFPKSPFAMPARIGEANVLSQLERYEEAKTACAKALQQTSTDSDKILLHLILLNCDLRTNKIDEALVEAENIRSKADKGGASDAWTAFDTYGQIGGYYMQTRQPDKAIAEMRGFLVRYPSSEAVWSARVTLGEYQLSAGRIAEAREEYLKAVNEHPRAKDKKPPDVVLYAGLRLAYSYEQERNYVEAIRLYQQLADNHPETHQAKQAKQRLEELKKSLEEKPKAAK